MLECKAPNDSPDLGVAVPWELMEVIVLVRLVLPFSGTGGGMVRRPPLLLMLRSIVAPRIRRLLTGLGCVGVTVRLLHARETRGVLFGPEGFVLKPRMLQLFRDSTIAM